MIDYLYYRFYRLWLHSSVSEGATFLAMLLFSVMLSTTLIPQHYYKIFFLST